MSNSNRTPLLIAGGGLLIGLAMGLIVFFGLPTPRDTRAAAGSTAGAQVLGASPVVGAQAPDFSLTDLAGNQVSLAGAKGRPVLINFWATWCTPCRDEMPAIERRYQANKDKGLLVYAIDYDEGRGEVEDFVKAFNLTFDVLLDPGGKVNDLYRIIGYPTTYVIDAEGVIQAVYVGQLPEAQLDEYVAKVVE